MSKIIIHNDVPGLEDSLAMHYISKVVDMGKIASGGKGDYYAPSISLGEYGRITVTCEMREGGTYTFKLIDSLRQKEKEKGLL